MTLLQQTRNDRERARLVGQTDLGAWVEMAGWKLWSIQHHALSELSIPRAVVTMPSCNSSGKTFLAGRVVWAFLDSFKPGTPCRWCYENGSADGRCGGAKVITTSSTWDHLKLTLWTEIRVARRALRGTMFDDLPRAQPSATETVIDPEHPEWFAVGLNPDTAEGMTGIHAPHKLILGEEATALSPDVADGINGLLASGDARGFFIYNPTDEDAWVEQIGADPNVSRIRVRAWDTPLFTGEPVPKGASLTTPDWTDDLRRRGMGPGTETWERRVEARPWGMGERSLVPLTWYRRARDSGLRPVGAKHLGIDLARYGDAECTITYRTGPVVHKQEAFPAMDQRIFWRGPVVEACRDFAPNILVYDADGLGAGVGESVAVLEETLRREGINTEILPFRGGGDGGEKFLNIRSMKWWQLRTLFEQNHIRIDVDDARLQKQMTSILYSFNEKGKIKVESKENMRKRKLASPDRADGVCYAFAYDAPEPVTAPISAVPDRSDESHWKRVRAKLDEEDRERDQFGRRHRSEIDPITGVSDDEW